ncbi:common pilus major fimbrillin subunit EcpA, partial [Escherichia coli]|uniref:common pilus major fimbrillin subunit EcpA n=1 Tax=Escherichia coli TaxID=562 RepID=UPI00208DAA17
MTHWDITSSIQLGKKCNEKKVLAIALVTVFTGMGVAQAADVTAQAVATWSATAKKDTTSKLVVTPLGSLAFQYAEGIKGLNLQSKCNKKRSTHQLEYNFVSTQKPFPNDEYFLPTSYNKR